ncbi:Reverse transcriptase domain - like 10 [Theobroma cacao]|nr:Reverse transcriptase domain - like 10 [Theobroma cacao]
MSSLYKILAKTLANKLKIVIGEVIGNNRFAFIKGRKLLDYVLIANEVVNWLKKDASRGTVLKLDFEKTFDSISWNFLDHVMGYMVFGVKWRCWIKECISTAKISIFVNGSPSRQFCIERCLWLRCPFSPLLFNIASEASMPRYCYESVSSLKVNYTKSHLIGIGIDQILVGRWATKIMCKVGYLPTTYLGLLLGAKHNSTRFWDPVLEKVGRKLAG